MAVDFTQAMGAIRTTVPLDASRQELIRKSFLWLFIAILAFSAFEFVLFATGIADLIAKLVFSVGKIGWLVVMGGFVLVGTLCSNLAHSKSKQTQLIGYSAYIVCEGLIFTPMLYVAERVSPSIIPISAAITFLITGGLCASVIALRSNFSFMRPFLTAASLGALGLIVISAFMGFNLGILFSFAMVLLAAGYILLTTSNILHEYGPDQHIGAATELFAAVALLFWYILRIAIEIAGKGK